MYEVELKVRASHDRLRTRLAATDATLSERVRQVDTYYDAPHRSFAETDEALRIRRTTALPADPIDSGGADPNNEADPDPTAVLTYKGPLLEAESKSREEFESELGDPEAVDEALSRLGFSPAATVEKERTYYVLDGYTVTLDDVAGLGEFVEVEREQAEAGIEAVREGARELLEGLGLDPDEQIRTSYLGLLLAGPDEPSG